MIEEVMRKLLISMFKKTKQANTQENLFWISKYLYSLNTSLIITKHVLDIQIILSHIIQMRSWLTQAHSSDFLIALTSIEIGRKPIARLCTKKPQQKTFIFKLEPLQHPTPFPKKSTQLNLRHQIQQCSFFCNVIVEY